MNKLTVIVLIFLLSVVGLLSGCSSSATNSNSDGGTVTITMAVSGSAQEKQLRYDTGNLFMKKYPNIKIKWTDLGNDDRYQKTLTLIAGGNPPDIFYINDWMYPLAQKGVLMPLDDFIKKDSSFNPDDFYKSLIETGKYQGKQYAIPQEVSPFVVYYNKDLFDKAGVPYPKDNWTEDDFIAAAKKLTDPNKKQFGTNFAGQWGGFLNRHGAHIYSQDGKKSGFDTPEALNALETMKKVVVDDHYSPNPAEQQAMGQGSEALFRNQKVAMVSAGMWFLPDFKAQPLSFKWDTVRMPKALDQSTKAGVLDWGISAQTKHPKEAWEILKFFVGHEGMKEVAQYNMALPASKDKEANQMILDSKFPGNVKAFVDSAPDVNLEEVQSAKSAEVNQAIQEQMDLMFLNKQTPGQTQKKIVSKMNSILGQ